MIMSNESAKEHEVVVKNRSMVNLAGVKKVEHFDAEQFLLETKMGFLIIRGQGLEMKGFDKQKGVVEIQGTVNELIYQNELPVEKSKKFFQKIFR